MICEGIYVLKVGSTRKIQNIVSHLGIEEISPTYVSRVSKELDEKVEEFLSRPIEHEIPYLFVDASYFKVRDGVRYETLMSDRTPKGMKIDDY